MTVLLAALALAAFMLSGCEDLEIMTERGGGEQEEEILIDEIPDWSGTPYIEINGNLPEFTDGEIKKAKKALRKSRHFQEFTELDGFGRCGAVTAVLSQETMPEGDRGTIGMIQPSGWQLDKYDFIDNGGYLYNRCHLIGWQLSGLNEEERNLITGTRYMNVEGMLPFENKVADSIKTSGVHVLYRATPVFRRKELVARGVQLEAYSIEDDGKSLSFNVFCYNVQPGVIIKYKNGKNRLDPDNVPAVKEKESASTDAAYSGADYSAGDDTGNGSENQQLIIPDGVTYILNNNTMRFHRTECDGAKTIREHNREWFYGSREEAVRKGYIPCGMCKP